MSHCRQQFLIVLDAKGNVLDESKYHWLQGRQVWTFSKLFNGDPTRIEYFDVAHKGFKFMAKAKGEDNKLYFSSTRSGEPLHFQEGFKWNSESVS